MTVTSSAYTDFMLYPLLLHDQFEVFVGRVAVLPVQQCAADHLDQAHCAAITDHRQVRMHAAVENRKTQSDKGNVLRFGDKLAVGIADE